MVYRFEPTEVGTTQMQFELRPTGEPEGQPGNTLDITVIVSE